MQPMILCLLTRTDYSAVIGWAEWSFPEEYNREDHSRITGYDTDGRQLFSRQGARHAERRAHELGMRLVIGHYFGLDESRPEDESAPAYMRRRYARLLERAHASRMQRSLPGTR